MPSKKRKFGDLGEKIAEQYLLKNGYFILERNFQTKTGELDIIAFRPQNKVLYNVNREIGKFFTNNREIGHAYRQAMPTGRPCLPAGRQAGKNNRENLMNKEIIRKNGLIVFVEVKSSLMSGDQNVSRETFSSKIRPEDNVHFKKQRHLIKSAQNYLAYKQFPLDINWQIDVIAIDIDEISHKANLRHIKRAVTNL